MGIPYLTRYLLPYAETVSLGTHGDRDEPPQVHAVVIDGPSLVYHVYHRLFAWTDSSCDVLDVQPTCDEVSCGVASFLFQLTGLGVEMYRVTVALNVPTLSDFLLDGISTSMGHCRSRKEIHDLLELRSQGNDWSLPGAVLSLKNPPIARLHLGSRANSGGIVVCPHDGGIFPRTLSWCLQSLRTSSIDGVGDVLRTVFNKPLNL